MKFFLKELILQNSLSLIKNVLSQKKGKFKLSGNDDVIKPMMIYK